MLQPQGLERAKVAAVRNSRLKANWNWCGKQPGSAGIALESSAVHQGNFDNAPIDDARLKREIEALAGEASARLELTAHDRLPGGGYGALPSPSAGGPSTARLSSPAGSRSRWTASPWRRHGPTILPGRRHAAHAHHAQLLESLERRPFVSTRLAPAGPRRRLVQVQCSSTRIRRGQGLRARQLLPFWGLTSEQD